MKCLAFLTQLRFRYQRMRYRIVFGFRPSAPPIHSSSAYRNKNNYTFLGVTSSHCVDQIDVYYIYRVTQLLLFFVFIYLYIYYTTRVGPFPRPSSGRNKGT